jgi:hypothetical protein
MNNIPSLCLLLLTLPLACGGRAAPSADAPFSQSAAFDDAGAYGGTFAATDASASAPSPAVGVDTGPIDDATADDATPDASPSVDDAGDDGGCTAALAPGDLSIDELMVESVDGTGDHGEWLEVKSNLPCSVNLRGLHGECPRGAKSASFDVQGDLWIPANGTFVVGDSVSPAVNHDLPTPVVAWNGNLGDVLRNKGTTVTLSANDVVIDTLTYPALLLTVGTSIAFPADCDPSTRADFTRWQPSIASWFPGFRGTPNAPNTDVVCPM